MAGADRGPVFRVPLAAKAPLHAPEAVQELVPVELQVREEVPPRATAPGDAVSVAVGNGFTVTATLAGALLPPSPEQDSAKVALLFNAPLLWLPLVGSMPLQAPAALHEVALVDVHVSVADWPASIVVGEVMSETVGAGVGEGALPPQADSNVIGTMIRRQYKERTSSQVYFLAVYGIG